MNYDFSQLNDKEFEILATDLLSSLYQTRIERFKVGRDGGVDGRFFSSNNKEIILQCKHYLKTGYSGLISKLKNEETAKVNKLKPHRYIFITSLPLSRVNKQEIQKIFSPYIKREDDIFGQEELNDLLAKNPQIEEKHFKLWITSTNVFNRIINNAIKGRSEEELRQIQEKSFKYIQTKNHQKAKNILKQKRVLIISGEPGVGKTTLAENLCLYFAAEGYDFVSISESLSEAENIYAQDRKQIFYFDDFLGSNYFEAIEHNKDSHIVKFIKRIQNDETKIFILSSRTNILNSGRLHSPILANSKIQTHEFMLSMGSSFDQSDEAVLDKAKILYNHIWFSNLPESFIDQIYEGQRYKKIIAHKNFNPRLIEFITDKDRINLDNSSNYWAYVESTLNNPTEIWSNCFKVQNNDFVRNLIFLTVFNGRKITEHELQKSFYRLNKLTKLTNPSHTEKDFNSMVKLAIKSFLNKNQLRYQLPIDYYTLFNPSIADFVLKEYAQDTDKLIPIFQALNSTKSLEQLINLEQNKIITPKNSLKIKNAIFEDAFQEEKSDDYLIYTSYLLSEDSNKKNIIIKFLKNIVQHPSVIKVKEISKLLELLIQFQEELGVQDYNLLFNYIDDYGRLEVRQISESETIARYLDESEISVFANFLEIFKIEDKNILDKFKLNLENFIESNLDNSDLSAYIYYENNYYRDYDDYDDEEIDKLGIEEELSNIAKKIINSFNPVAINKININIKTIIKDMDIHEKIRAEWEVQRDTFLDDKFGDYEDNIYNNSIDDLFTRS